MYSAKVLPLAFPTTPTLPITPICYHAQMMIYPHPCLILRLPPIIILRTRHSSGLTRTPLTLSPFGPLRHSTVTLLCVFLDKLYEFANRGVVRCVLEN